MHFEWLIAVAAFLLLAALITAYVCYYMIFYSNRKKARSDELIPEGEIYAPYKENLVKWIDEVLSLPHTDAIITSFDGLKLMGRYFEFSPGAPIELMFHGYKGNSVRDLSGGVLRCRKLGHNVLIVDHRASGRSEGHVITFGVNERRDCRAWVDYIINNIDSDAKIILTGISMGAATVMMASSIEDMPKNVVGVLADCGYTSARDIIKKVIRDMHLPANLLYPFARLGASIFGRFNLDEYSPIEAMPSCKLPILFFHGDTDDFVPHEMSIRNYEACASSRKRMVTIESAGHGLCFPTDKEKYYSAMREFFSYIPRT